jgi:hypothetical protein
MSAGYPDVNWSVRLARTVLVVAIALLSGAVIGGASVYLISDALTGPEPSVRTDAGASKAAADNVAPGTAQTATSQPTSQPTTSAEGKPVKTIDPALPAPASSPSTPLANAPGSQPADAAATQSQAAAPQSSSSPAAASASQPAPEDPQISNPQIAPQPVPQGGPAQKSWPDALSRVHPSTAPDSASNSQKPPQPNAPRAAEKTGDNDNNDPAARMTTSNETGAEDKSAPAQKRPPIKTIGRRTQDAARDMRRDTGRPVYDYYGEIGDRDRQDSLPAPERVVPPRPDQTTTRTWHSSSKIKARIIVRRQDDSNQGDDRSDEADRALPPQPPPAQSFLGGLFGGDRNDSWQPDDRDR